MRKTGIKVGKRKGPKSEEELKRQKSRELFPCPAVARNFLRKSKRGSGPKGDDVLEGSTEEGEIRRE